MTISDLHNDPRKMAAFMGWPYEADEVTEWKISLYRPFNRIACQRKRTAAQATRERYAEFQQLLAEGRKQSREQTHSEFVRECAREALGVKGKSAEEVVRKVAALKPEAFELNESSKK